MHGRILDSFTDALDGKSASTPPPPFPLEPYLSVSFCVSGQYWLFCTVRLFSVQNSSS